MLISSRCRRDPKVESVLATSFAVPDRLAYCNDAIGGLMEVVPEGTFSAAEPQNPFCWDTAKNWERA